MHMATHVGMYGGNVLVVVAAAGHVVGGDQVTKRCGRNGAIPRLAAPSVPLLVELGALAYFAARGA